MALSTLNRRQSSVRQQRRWWQLLLPLLATVLALPSLVTSAPTKRNVSPYAFNVTQALEQATWISPCGKNGQGSNGQEHVSSFNKTAKFLHMERQIKLTLLDLGNWRVLSGRNNSGTTWNGPFLKHQVLQPFLKNQYSWERRLSVYWAYLRVINVFHAQYSDTTNINHSEADALETVNEANRQLLCIVREYREMTNPNQKNKTIDAAHMERKIRFFIQDAAEIKIHIWYVMCRLECFLTNMRKHLHQLLDKSKRPRKPVNVMNCKACPYCVKSDEREQSEPAKNRKHRKQQRQQQQPKQNNRTEHGGQQKQKSKQQQQRPSRQPKGRKGTSRAPSNRGRKC